MAYPKDVEWTIELAGGAYTYDQARLAVLMDIRSELRQLRELFTCANFRMLPSVIGAIEKNVRKPKKKRGPQEKKGGPRKNNV